MLTFCGNMMDDSEIHPVNAPSLIDVTESGMYTDIRDTQPVMYV